MSIAPDTALRHRAAPHPVGPHHIRRFRLIRGSGPGPDRVVPEPEPKQPMTASALLDLGADAYLAPASVPALAAHVKALTRSWDAFPPLPADRRNRQTA